MDNNTNPGMPPQGGSMYVNNSGEKGIGPMIGLIVILLIIVLGGIYFWMNRTSYNATNNPNGENQSETIDFSSEIILEQSPSDEPDEIESDLNAFGEAEINSLDSGI
jgi:hypothetical protein